MAVIQLPETLEIHRFPQSNYIDAIKWLQTHSPFEKFATIALHNPDSTTSTIEIHALNLSHSPILTPQSSWTSPHRISSLRVSKTHHKPLVAAATRSGSVHVLLTDPNDVKFDSEFSVRIGSIHDEPISGFDLNDDGLDCVCVGYDGRVNVVSVVDSGLECRRVYDSRGLVSYSAAKWASPTEFATGGLGFSLQWWDQRKPGAAVSQFKANWVQGATSGIVHSIDIHPSRKHTCLAGGSLGTVFAWDLRWPQQPVILSRVGSAESSPSDSEIWEVQFDPSARSLNIRNTSSSTILPAMICSEDGILALVEQGEEPFELLAEACAINNFDIDQQNPTDVICSLEWESVAILRRT